MAIVRSTAWKENPTGAATKTEYYYTESAPRTYPSSTTLTATNGINGNRPTALASRSAYNAATTPTVTMGIGTAPGGPNTVSEIDKQLKAKIAETTPASSGNSGSGGFLSGLGDKISSAISSMTTNPGGYVAAPTDNNDYMSQLSSMLSTYQNQQQAQLAAQQAAQEQMVRDAYSNNRAALQNAYNARNANLENIYGETLGRLSENYDYDAEKIARNAENALREAYINRMMSQKNLQQQLNAQGLTGGAAESVIAGLMNNYGNARNNIETQRMNDLASLLNTYQNNLAKANENYANARNEVEAANQNYLAQMERDRTSGLVGTYDNLYNALASGSNTYANAMQGLAASQIGNAADLAATNYKNYANAVNKGTTTKNSSSLSVSGGGDSSIVGNLAQRLAAGEDASTLLTSLTANGMSMAEAVAALRQAGYNF